LLGCGTCRRHIQEWNWFLPELKSRQLSWWHSVPCRDAVRLALSFEVNDLAGTALLASTLETFSLLWHGLCTVSVPRESFQRPEFKILFSRKQESALKQDTAEYCQPTGGRVLSDHLSDLRKV
jgi:hypothetical protein